MSSDSTPVTITILDKEYRIACPPDERNELLECANLLNQRMREIRRNGVIGADGVVVLAALNLTHDLLNEQSLRQESGEALSNRLRSLQERIGAVLDEQRQTEP